MPHERPLAIGFDCIDAHHHLWEKAKAPPGTALTKAEENSFGNNPAREAPYMPDDLLGDMEGNGVVATVYVESTNAFVDPDAPPHLQSVAETRRCQQISDETASSKTHLCAGIVARANLSMGFSVDEVLQAHVAAAPRALRGIRQQTFGDPSPDIVSKADPKILTDPSFQDGFSLLEKYKLSADVVVYHPQLPSLINLAHKFPNIPIICDHVGGPLGVGPYENQRSMVVEVWQEHIHDLAKCPNVSIKLSGLAMPVCGFDFHKRTDPVSSEELAKTFGPYFRNVIREFGTARCMFASNFPIDKVSCEYTTLWNAYKRIVSDLPGRKQKELFYDTAHQVYRL